MGSIIRYQTWAGGGGFNDPKILLGYCKESPVEVLQAVILTHDIYHYKELYMPIDQNFPNNTSGLVIEEFERKDLKIIGNLSDIDLSVAITKSERNKDTLLKSLDWCIKFHHRNQVDLREKYESMFKEVQYVIDKL